MIYLAIFAAGCASVFLLGFQSRCVNSGNFVLAAGNAFLVAVAQGQLWTVIASPAAGWWGAFAYGAGASVGIVAAMWVHRRWFTK